MNFFKRRRILKKANLLELTPVRLYEHELTEEGKIIIIVPKFKNPEISRFMLGNRSSYFRIKLDEMGSEVWLSIDGKSNVAELVENLQEKWKEIPEKAVELEKRFGKFLSQLYDNRYVTFKELAETK